jgi:hypothetical protein
MKRIPTFFAMKLGAQYCKDCWIEDGKFMEAECSTHPPKTAEVKKYTKPIGGNRVVKPSTRKRRAKVPNNASITSIENRD